VTAATDPRGLYSDDDLRVIVQDWDESDPDQAVAINLARECLNHRRVSSSECPHGVDDDCCKQCYILATDSDLLLALERLVAESVHPYDGMEYEDGEWLALDNARAAIAKAKGVQP